MSDYRKQIRKQVRRTIKKPIQSTNAQATILSGLNVLQTLEVQAPQYLKDVLHYGPESFVGDEWATTLIWFRKKGYHQYKVLTLFGVWAVTNEDETELLIGTKKLKFTAPVFNPESYTQLIKRNFQTHYKDDASSPPDDDIIKRISYNESNRLALRQDLKIAIIQWMRHRAK